MHCQPTAGLTNPPHTPVQELPLRWVRRAGHARCEHRAEVCGSAAGVSGAGAAAGRAGGGQLWLFWGQPDA